MRRSRFFVKWKIRRLYYLLKADFIRILTPRRVPSAQPQINLDDERAKRTYDPPRKHKESHDQRRDVDPPAAPVNRAGLADDHTFVERALRVSLGVAKRQKLVAVFSVDAAQNIFIAPNKHYVRLSYIRVVFAAQLNIVNTAAQERVHPVSGHRQLNALPFVEHTLGEV